MNLATLKEIEDQKQKLAEITASHGDKLIAQKLEISRRFRDDVKKYLEAQQFTTTASDTSLIANYKSVEIALETDPNPSRWTSHYKLTCSANNVAFSVTVTPQGGVNSKYEMSKHSDELVRLGENISIMENACKPASAEAYEIAYRTFNVRQPDLKVQSVEILINAAINAAPNQKKPF